MNNQFKNTKDFTFTDTVDYHRYLTLPVTTIEGYADIENELQSLKRVYDVNIADQDDEPEIVKMSWYEKMNHEKTSYDHTLSAITLYSHNTLLDTTVNEEWKNHTVARFKNSNIKPKVGTVLKGRNAITAVRQRLDLSRDSIIPLPHSHFSIKIKSLSPTERIKFNELITEAMTDYCSDSAGLILSNDSAVYNKVIIDYIRNIIIYHTLDTADDIMDYVDPRDMISLFTYLSTAMHPKGVETILTCRNSVVVKDNETYDKDVKEDSKTSRFVCTHSLKGLLSARDSLYVLEDKITELGKELLSRTKEASITLKELEESKADASYHGDSNFKINDIKFNINFGSVSRVLASGDRFINRLLELVDDTVLFMDNEEDRIKEINKFLIHIAINKYSHFIESIDMGDLGIITEQADIFNVLENLIEEEDYGIGIIEKINDLLVKGKISAMAIPLYTCKGCNKTASADSEISDYGKLVEINALEVFIRRRIM